MASNVIAFRARQGKRRLIIANDNDLPPFPSAAAGRAS